MGVALLYHDVVESDKTESSGLVTPGSWRYKIAPEKFQEHLERVSELGCKARLITDELESNNEYFTFDDGGVSCFTKAVPLLEKHGFKDHFFVVTGRIGDDGFLNDRQVEELACRGHHVGSHTYTHPDLTSLPRKSRLEEQRESKQTIEEIIDGKCNSLSTHGGAYNGAVLSDAFEVGYSYVFTSEPRDILNKNDEEGLGRWNIWHDTYSDEVEKIIDADLIYRAKIRSRWYFLKITKKIIGKDNFVKISNLIAFRD